MTDFVTAGKSPLPTPMIRPARDPYPPSPAVANVLQRKLRLLTEAVRRFKETE